MWHFNDLEKEWRKVNYLNKPKWTRHVNARSHMFKQLLFFLYTTLYMSELEELCLYRTALDFIAQQKATPEHLISLWTHGFDTVKIRDYQILGLDIFVFWHVTFWQNVFINILDLAQPFCYQMFAQPQVTNILRILGSYTKLCLSRITMSSFQKL